MNLSMHEQLALRETFPNMDELLALAQKWDIEDMFDTQEENESLYSFYNAILTALAHPTIGAQLLQIEDQEETANILYYCLQENEPPTFAISDYDSVDEVITFIETYEKTNKDFSYAWSNEYLYVWGDETKLSEAFKDFNLIA